MATDLQLGDFDLIRQGGPLLTMAVQTAEGRRKELLELAVLAFESNSDPVSLVISELNPAVDAEAIAQAATSASLAKEVRAELDAALAINRAEIQKLYGASNQTLQEYVSAQLAQLKHDLLESGALQQIISKVVGQILQEQIQQQLTDRLLGLETTIDAIEENLEQKLEGFGQTNQTLQAQMTTLLGDLSGSLTNISQIIGDTAKELSSQNLLAFMVRLEDMLRGVSTSTAIENVNDRLTQLLEHDNSDELKTEFQTLQQLIQGILSQLETLLSGASISTAIENISDRLNQLMEQGRETQQKTLELNQAISAVQQQIAATGNVEELFKKLQANIQAAAAEAAAQAQAEEEAKAAASAKQVVPPRLSGLIDLRSVKLSELGLQSYEPFTLSNQTAYNSDFWIGQDDQLGLMITRLKHGWQGAFTLSNVGGDGHRTFEMIVGYHWRTTDKGDRVQAMPGLIDDQTDLQQLGETSILKMLHQGQWLDAKESSSSQSRGFKSVYWKDPASGRGYGSQDPIAGTDLILEPGTWAKLTYPRGGQAGGLCRMVTVTGKGADPFAASEETGTVLQWTSANPNQISHSLVFCFPIYKTQDGELRVLAVKVT